MPNRFMLRSALMGLALLLPAAAWAADEQTPKLGKPALILRLASVNQLRGDILYLAQLVGQGEKAKQFDKIIDSKVGDKGLEGIDLKKPLGLYGWVGGQGIDSSLVIVVPVRDSKAFLALLDNFEIKPDKGDDGVYSVNLEKVPFPIYFRFANGYAYIAPRDKDMLDKDKLLAPADVFPAGGVGALSLTVNIDRIPNDLKEMGLGALDLQLANAKEEDVAKETKAEKKFRKAAIDEFGKAVKSLLREGGESSLRLDLDRKSGSVTLTAGVQGKSGSALAKTIENLGKIKSVPSALLHKDAAINGELNVRLPEKLRELLGPVLEEGQTKALKKAKNKNEREVMKTLIEAILPTFKAAELDAAFNLQGPNNNGRYCLIGGVKIKDGAKLEKTFRQAIVKDASAGVKLNVAKVGSVSIHRVATKDADKDFRRAFGNNSLHIAFREDVLLVAVGDKGLSVLKEALALKPAMGKVMELQVSVARLAPLMQDKTEAKIARKVFAAEKGSDRVRLTLEGGKALKLQLSLKAKLIEYAYRIGEAKKK